MKKVKSIVPVLMASIIMTSSIPVYAETDVDSVETLEDGWHEDENGKYYIRDGEKCTGVFWDGDSCYYLDENGYMVIGWARNPETGKRYYAAQDGTLVTGWQYDDTGLPIYYFSTDEETYGQMITGWYKEKESGAYYYFSETDGKMVTGWFQDMNDDGNWYYLSKDSEDYGKMKRGWLIDETGWKTYYLDSNGRMLKNQWINASANNELGRPEGMYKLTSDGAVQMNGWAESVTPGIYWFLRSGDGWFDKNNSKCWANQIPGTVFDDEVAKKMDPIFESITRWKTEHAGRDMRYDRTNPECVWTVLHCTVQSGDIPIDMVYINNIPYRKVPASVIKEYAATLFSGMRELPAIVYEGVTYDSATDSYLFSVADPSQSYVQVEGYVRDKDGSYLVTLTRRDWYGNEYARFLIRIERNTYTGNPKFPFAIREIIE